MSVVHTVTAYCDEPECTESLALSPQSSQQFVELTRRGWSLVTTSEDIDTFCPKHAKPEDH